MHKLRHWILLALFSVTIQGISLQSPAAEYKEGVQYKVLKTPLPKVIPEGKIEVETVFWYGCSHCYDLSVLEKDWKKTLGKDVINTDLPVVFGKPWQAHAQLFYTLEEMKLLDKAHLPVFEAVQKKGERLDNEKDMKTFLSSRFSVKPADFDKAYGSFGVMNQVQKAGAATRGAQLTGVPAIIINGRYLIDPVTAGGLDKMLQVSDYVIETLRKENAKGVKKAADKPEVKKAELPASKETDAKKPASKEQPDLKGQTAETPPQPAPEKSRPTAP